MTKKIVAIWAQDEEGLIGKDGRLPWTLPADLKHFKKTTIGHAMVMGRVTFDGMGQRSLPNRLSIVLTRDGEYEANEDRVLVFHSVSEVLDWQDRQENPLFIIGGSQIFQTFEPYLDELIVTEIHGIFEGDAYFPEDFDWTVFKEVEQEFHQRDAENPVDFTVKRFERIENT